MRNEPPVVFRHLTLHCACGQTRAFRGRDVAALIVQIDKSRWQDLPGGSAGHKPAYCPDCEERLEAVRLAVGPPQP